jgi:hypothetical protein
MGYPIGSRQSRKCAWCGRRKSTSAGCLKLVSTGLGDRLLCFECRNGYLPIFGGGKPYGKEGVADAGGEDKAKAGAERSEARTAAASENELASSAERSRAS